MSWVKRQFEATATRYLKRWTGLTKSANPNIFYIPRSEGGLQFPSISTLYKKLQVSKHCQLLTSKDATVRHLAEKNLETKIKSIRKIFKPSTEVQQTMVEDPSQSRKALLKAVKNKVAYSDASRHKSELLALPVQGLLFTIITTPAKDPTKIWTDAIRSLPNECYKFVLTAAHDTLPHNSNLHLWKKKPNPWCPLCGHQRQTLLHVLNNCETALHHRKYNQRHDEVLKEIASFINVNLEVSQNMIADLSSQTYSTPSHLPCTDLRPDIIWWDEHSKRTVVVELTICFDTLFKQAAERKKRKCVRTTIMMFPSSPLRLALEE